jgi:hypothetical protein
MNGMRAKVAALLVVGLVLAAGACGGGSSSDDAATGDAVQAESSSGGDSSSSGDINDLSDAMDALGGDCMQAGLAYFALSMQALGASFGMSESDIADMEQSMDELKAEIPSEIEDDFNVFADALSEYASAMQGMNLGDLMSGSSEAEDAAAILETPEVKEAQANIEAYFDENCPS